MARTKYKSGIVVFLCILLLDSVKLFPIVRSPVLETTDNVYTTALLQNEVNLENKNILPVEDEVLGVVANDTRQGVSLLSRQNIRPGQTVPRYTIEIKRNGNTFEGRALIRIRLTDDTTEDAIQLNAVGLNIRRLSVGVLTSINLVETPFIIEDDILEFTPNQPSSSYEVLVEYTAEFSNDGSGLYLGEFGDVDYIAMNLHPTNARRVFPCMDEPNLLTSVSFTFEDMGYNSIVSNAMLQVDSQTAFRPMDTPPHLWGMVAHNFNVLSIPTQNVHIYTRPMNQDFPLTSVAISNYFNGLNAWTEKEYLEIHNDQDGRMHVIAVPDISRDWTALSTVCIWEPYMLMENNNALEHRKIALVKIAEAMARQWFGFVLYPANWRHQWVVTGINSYAAYDIVKAFQTDETGLDESLLDMNTIFTTDVIQESLLVDAYDNSLPLVSSEDIFDENEVRLHINGMMRYKAPALLRMFRIIFGEQDLIQSVARALLRSRSMEPVSAPNFYEALLSLQAGENVVEDMETWVNNRGYPLVTVTLRSRGVILVQERFGFSPATNVNFAIPISYTTSVNPNFDNIYDLTVMGNSEVLDFDLGEEDWVIVNLQGQGYYRVNYDTELWERLTIALDDPERREQIHPLNRATLIDDALNSARANKLGYDIALQVVLTMEHETEYAAWKAFVRNMDFLRKRLVPYALDDDDRDDDIYLRMVRRTILAFEEEIGFEPQGNIEPAMVSLTRGLVMDHACRSGYDPCIAAAVDMFYDPNNNDVVNPNIPADLRPAVYCTMVSQGDEDVITALRNRMDREASRYERLVVLESMGCSQDPDFINSLLQGTINANEPYATEERSKIFAAIANSNVNNADLALRFMITRTNDIRNMYGGPEKLEEVIYILADNMVTADLSIDFTTWVNSLETISNLEDSNLAAREAQGRVTQNLAWNNNLMEQAYEWIDENDAPTLFVSSFLISIAVFISLFNH